MESMRSSGYPPFQLLTFLLSYRIPICLGERLGSAQSNQDSDDIPIGRTCLLCHFFLNSSSVSIPTLSNQHHPTLHWPAVL